MHHWFSVDYRQALLATQIAGARKSCTDTSQASRAAGGDVSGLQTHAAVAVSCVGTVPSRKTTQISVSPSPKYTHPAAAGTQGTKRPHSSAPAATPAPPEALPRPRPRRPQPGGLGPPPSLPP